LFLLLLVVLLCSPWRHYSPMQDLQVLGPFGLQVLGP